MKISGYFLISTTCVQEIKNGYYIECDARNVNDHTDCVICRMFFKEYSEAKKYENLRGVAVRADIYVNAIEYADEDGALKRFNSVNIKVKKIMEADIVKEHENSNTGELV